MSDWKTALIERYPDEIEKFKQFCLANCDDDAFEELHWRDVSVGFFVALGVVEDTINPEDEKESFADALGLATICRYDYQYWC